MAYRRPYLQQRPTLFSKASFSIITDINFIPPLDNRRPSMHHLSLASKPRILFYKQEQESLADH